LDGETSPFSLEGAAGFGHLVAAHWDEFGLLVAASSGVTLECPGAPVAGRWQCSRIEGAVLPISSAGQLFRGSVALARQLGGTLRAAVSFPDEPTVMVFARSAANAAPWRLTGELRSHAPAASAAFVDGAARLLLASADGAVASMNMKDGSLTSVAPALEGEHDWKAICGSSSGGVSRLAITTSNQPMLFML